MTNVLIINGHPDGSPERFCAALAQAYAGGAERGGHAIRKLQIANCDIGFLRSADAFHNEEPNADIVKAQQDIAWAEHIVLIYPLWLGTIPALLKAFLEQTLRPGFAFSKDDGSGKWPKMGLEGRSARVVVTMGMPATIYRWYFFSHSLKSLERHIIKFVGISPVAETIIGMVGELSESERTKWLDDLRALGEKAA